MKKIIYLLLVSCCLVSCSKNNSRINDYGKPLDSSFYVQWYENGVYHEIVDTTNIDDIFLFYYAMNIDPFHYFYPSERFIYITGFEQSWNKDSRLVMANRKFYLPKHLTFGNGGLAFRYGPAGYYPSNDIEKRYESYGYVNNDRYIAVDKVTDMGVRTVYYDGHGETPNQRVFILEGTFNDTLQCVNVRMDSTCSCASYSAQSFIKYSGKFRLPCAVEE